MLINSRQEKEKLEHEAMEKIVQIHPALGRKLEKLWHEFEARETLEAKIAKASDVLCAVFQRIRSQHSYTSRNIDITRLDDFMLPYLSFSRTFMTMYKRLKVDLINQGLIS